MRTRRRRQCKCPVRRACCAGPRAALHAPLGGRRFSAHARLHARICMHVRFTCARLSPRRAASGELAVPTAPRCSGYTDLEAAGSSRPKSLFEVVSTRELPGGMSSRVASLFGCARGPRIWSCVVQECAAVRPFYSCLFARCLAVQLHAGSRQPRYAGLTLTQPPPRRCTGSRRRARGAPTTAGVASRGAAAIGRRPRRGRPGTVAAAIARARRPERQGLLRRRPSRQRRMRAARRRRRRPCGPAR